LNANRKKLRYNSTCSDQNVALQNQKSKKMKSIFVTIIMVLIFGVVNAQRIGECRIQNSNLDIFDAIGSYKCSIKLKAGDELSGYSRSIIVISADSIANVFNDKGESLSTINLRNGDYVLNVLGNTVLIRSDSITNVFDDKGKLLSSK